MLVIQSGFHYPWWQLNILLCLQILLASPPLSSLSNNNHIFAFTEKIVAIKREIPQYPQNHISTHKDLHLLCSHSFFCRKALHFLIQCRPPYLCNGLKTSLFTQWRVSCQQFAVIFSSYSISSFFYWIIHISIQS